MRRRHEEEHVETEKWAIPYADLLTLLLAFFVVMYSLSTVNEAKFRVLAQSLNHAFNGHRVATASIPAQDPGPPGRAVIRIDLPSGAAAPALNAHDPAEAVVSQPDARPGPAQAPDRPPVHAGEGAAPQVAGGAQGSQGGLRRLAAALGVALKPWIGQGQVILRHTPSEVQMEIRTDVLFGSASSDLSEQAVGILDRAAAVLDGFPNPVRVEGYTDDRPIHTGKYPSNWELSAARAGSVARLFAAEGMNPGRIAVTGWGAMHPVAGNDTAKGRAQNRRISVVVLGAGPVATKP